MNSIPSFENPFRPGAGHMPPYLAGRDQERQEFRRLLEQSTVLENVILSGLRGTGKTVLLETLRPIALQEGWLWVGTDLSESTSINELAFATRLLTDLSVVTSSIKIEIGQDVGIGFGATAQVQHRDLNYRTLTAIFEATPGLIADKLKATLEHAWRHIGTSNARGIVFAYDEAQTMSDHPTKDEFPLSLMLDVFQSIQRKDIPFLLALTGLPTLFPKLVEARTFSERMFHMIVLHQLVAGDCREAILKPIVQEGCPVMLDDDLVTEITEVSGGYPYFVQFICKEVYDIALVKAKNGQPLEVVIEDIVRKLDSDFFAGRWARATDRQRELLAVAASLDTSGGEFTVQELVNRSRDMLGKPFSSSHINQMLASLSTNGLIYRNRHGKYSFAVPLMDHFIRRQIDQGNLPGAKLQAPLFGQARHSD